MYTQIVNGQKSTLNICSACASGESIFDNFGSILNFGVRPSAQNTVCPVCNMTLSEFSRKGRAGCGECYRTFRAHASAMLRKIHGSAKHVTVDEQAEEKTQEVKPKNPVEELKEQLKKAIMEENFEQAAVLRDKIREAENSQKGENE